jgi:hypothetical protein
LFGRRVFRDPVHIPFNQIEVVPVYLAEIILVMPRVLLKLVFLLIILVSTGGWIWFLGAGIRWLVVN